MIAYNNNKREWASPAAVVSPARSLPSSVSWLSLPLLRSSDPAPRLPVPSPASWPTCRSTTRCRHPGPGPLSAGRQLSGTGPGASRKTRSRTRCSGPGRWGRDEAGSGTLGGTASWLAGGLIMVVTARDTTRGFVVWIYMYLGVNGRS